MMQAKRIGEHLLDMALRELLESSTKIFPIEYSDIVANLNPHNYEFARVVSGPFKNNIYYWEQGPRVWSLIGADVLNIKWDDIEGIPGEFKPTEHKHTEEDISNLNKYTKEEIDLKLAEFTKTLVLQAWLDDKVDKVINKQLSTEDFTTELKSKLEALSNNATIDYDQMLTALNTHINDLSKHLTPAIIDSINTIGSKVNMTTFEGHTGNSSVHMTQTEKDAKADLVYVNNMSTDLTNLINTVDDKSIPTIGTIKPTNGSLWFRKK